MKDKKVLIVKNEHREGPGLIRTILQEKGVRFNVFNARRMNRFPEPEDYSAIIVLGGPQSANDYQMITELDFVSKSLESIIPYLGICLGMQVLSKVAGGEVYPAPFKEIGYRDPTGQYFQIELTEQGKADSISADVNNIFKLFQLHGETVRLSEGMELLGRGYGPNQIENQFVKVGKNAYGILGHLELTKSMLEEWIVQDPDLKFLNSDLLRKDYNDIKPEYESNGRKILTNFLKIAGVI